MNTFNGLNLLEVKLAKIPKYLLSGTGRSLKIKPNKYFRDYYKVLSLDFLRQAMKNYVPIDWEVLHNLLNQFLQMFSEFYFF